MARGSRETFPLVDKIVGGNLNERLAGWRAEGLPVDTIVDRLRDDFDVDMSRATVYKWVNRIEGGPTPRKPKPPPEPEEPHASWAAIV